MVNWLFLVMRDGVVRMANLDQCIMLIQSLFRWLHKYNEWWDCLIHIGKFHCESRLCEARVVWRVILVTM